MLIVQQSLCSKCYITRWPDTSNLAESYHLSVQATFYPVYAIFEKGGGHLDLGLKILSHLNFRKKLPPYLYRPTL